jgi:hypothetical protein
MLTYKEIYLDYKKGIRRKNWKKLGFLDKALYRAAMYYLKSGGNITSEKLIVKLSALVEKLKETKGMRIFKRGLEKAVEMLERGEEKGVFVWAPRLKDWLKEPNYIFWLGTVR